MDNPLCSIIIPTFNRTKYFLPKAIKSALKQSYKNIEVIVVNDCGENIDEVCESFKDDRLKWFANEKNSGLGATRNHGIKESKGNWLVFLDDDDRLYTFMVEELLEFSKKEGDKISYGNCFREHLKKNINGEYQCFFRDMIYNITYKLNPDVLKIMNISPVDSFFVHKDCFEKAGLFNEELKIYEDWEILLRISEFYELGHYEKPVAAYSWRTTGETMSSSSNGFTTLLPEIYKLARTLPLKNRKYVIEEQNKSLMSRRLEPIPDEEIQ
jgi:glycosyltransferase involved in cell wall biosynthesis